jgi:hypothetical protein
MKKRIKTMMMAMIQNVLLILKSPLWNTFYLLEVNRQHGFLSISIDSKNYAILYIMINRQKEREFLYKSVHKGNRYCPLPNILRGNGYDCEMSLDFHAQQIKDKVSKKERNGKEKG